VEQYVAHKMESLYKRLMELGFLFLKLFFTSQNKGNYGKTIKTAKGITQRGRPIKRAYFSIFGKMGVFRYIYHIGNEFISASFYHSTFDIDWRDVLQNRF